MIIHIFLTGCTVLCFYYGCRFEKHWKLVISGFLDIFFTLVFACALPLQAGAWFVNVAVKMGQLLILILLLTLFCIPVEFIHTAAVVYRVVVVDVPWWTGLVWCRIVDLWPACLVHTYSYIRRNTQRTLHSHHILLQGETILTIVKQIFSVSICSLIINESVLNCSLYPALLLFG